MCCGKENCFKGQWSYQLSRLRSPRWLCYKWSGCILRDSGCAVLHVPRDAGFLWQELYVHSLQWIHTNGQVLWKKNIGKEKSEISTHWQQYEISPRSTRRAFRVIMILNKGNIQLLICWKKDHTWKSQRFKLWPFWSPRRLVTNFGDCVCRESWRGCRFREKKKTKSCVDRVIDGRHFTTNLKKSFAAICFAFSPVD